MAQVLIRDLDPAVVKKLKAHAREHGRSLQAELRGILERAADTNMSKARRLSASIRRKLSDRRHSDSTELVAGDRAR